MEQIKSESRLTFMEATSIIIGHGVGSGILAVPYLASRNRWTDILWILALSYAVNLLMHLMIAELSLHNGGQQFVKCFEAELFTGVMKKIFTAFAFAMLGLSVILNVSGFIAGSSAVFSAWFSLPERWGMVLYYVLAAGVVFIGMKAVGICEKVSVSLMSVVVLVLLFASLRSPMPLSSRFISSGNTLALYGMVSFSLSAVMSVPQVVKGLDGNAKSIRGAIMLGTGVNALLLLIITFTTLLGAGSELTQRGALVDLASHLGGWVSIVGYVFTLLALSTSLWANTLNLRDIVHEQTGLGLRKSWLVSSLPSLVIALLGIQSFVGFTRLSGVIQILTGFSIIIAYHKSRKEATGSPICGVLGALPFQVIVLLGSVVATVGSLVHVA
jgi:hypothetical protein